MIIKIIIAIIVCLIGFCAFLYTGDLKELKEKATKEEKKALEIIEGIAILLPLFVAMFIMGE